MKEPNRVVRVLLLVVAWFSIVSVAVGVVGLTAGGGLGMSVESLDGSIFTSFLWPAVILGAVVGGSQVLALAAQYGRFRLAWGLHAAAGLIMVIWIFVELAILLAWSFLIGMYFVSGVVQTVLAVLALGAWPSPFFARTPLVDRRSRDELEPQPASKGMKLDLDGAE